MSRLLPIEQDGTLPSCLIDALQYTFKMLPTSLLVHSQVNCRVHSKYTLKYIAKYPCENVPKYTFMYVLKYTPPHALKDAPNCTQWHTPSLLDSMLSS